MSKWTNVPVSFTVELHWRETRPIQHTGVWDGLAYEKELPSVVSDEICKLTPVTCTGLELDFDVTSSGYYQPAVMYLRNGDPGYPEERDDERVVEGVYLLLNGKKGPQLSKASVDLLAALYRDEIQEANLPDQDYDGPDREDD